VYLCTYFADHAALCKPPHGADVPEGTDLRSGTTSPQGSLMTKLSSQQVGHLVRTALTRAASQELELRSPRSLVYMRSRAFCGALAAEMRSLYPAEDGFAVFAGRDPANRTKFGRQELMGDVSVYEVAEIPAGHHGSGNAYLKRARRLCGLAQACCSDAHFVRPTLGPASPRGVCLAATTKQQQRSPAA
jgi:hypothetical protein